VLSKFFFLIDHLIPLYFFPFFSKKLIFSLHTSNFVFSIIPFCKISKWDIFVCVLKTSSKSYTQLSLSNSYFESAIFKVVDSMSLVQRPWNILYIVLKSKAIVCIYLVLDILNSLLYYLFQLLFFL